LGNDSLVLTISSIVKRNEALGTLEEILIWLVWSELHTEAHGRVGINLSYFWSNSKWILNPLASGLVQYIK
jgi:hypothetical protein